jgi:hypothetical protein
MDMLGILFYGLRKNQFQSEVAGKVKSRDQRGSLADAIARLRTTLQLDIHQGVL